MFDLFPGPGVRDWITSSHEHATAAKNSGQPHDAAFQYAVLEDSINHIRRATGGVYAAFSEIWREQTLVKVNRD